MQHMHVGCISHWQNCHLTNVLTKWRGASSFVRDNTISINSWAKGSKVVKGTPTRNLFQRHGTSTHNPSPIQGTFSKASVRYVSKERPASFQDKSLVKKAHLNLIHIFRIWGCQRLPQDYPKMALDHDLIKVTLEAHPPQKKMVNS